jgi:hypothetical protein
MTFSISAWISSTVNEKATLKNPSICSMFQNAIIGNVAINIYVDRDALV